jgi:hypothetical protein
MRSPVAAKVVLLSDFYHVPSSAILHLAGELDALFPPTCGLKIST